MENVIVTGFEPFGPYKFNPVEEMSKDFNGRIIDGVLVHSIILPCTYKGAFEILEKSINKLSPSAIISTGLSSSVGGIRVEQTAYNLMDGKYDDADGLSPKGESIIKDGEYFLEMNSNSHKIANILRSKGIPTEMSSDAGPFICNSLMYLTIMHIINNNMDMKNIFLHTPWTDNYKGIIDELEPGKIWLPKENLYESVESVIGNISEI